MSGKNVVGNFFKESGDKFKTKRQASKYLNQYGTVYKTDKNVPLEYSKRTMLETTKTIKSEKNIKNKKR